MCQCFQNSAMFVRKYGQSKFSGIFNPKSRPEPMAMSEYAEKSK